MGHTVEWSILDHTSFSFSEIIISESLLLFFRFLSVVNKAGLARIIIAA